MCFISVSFTILKERSGSLFRFPEYLAPNGGASISGDIRNQTADIICGFSFILKSNPAYSYGFIQSHKSLNPGKYFIQTSWIEA